MEQWALIAVVAAVILGLFMLGMSITLIFKGHNIKSEIGENPEMRKRGIQCTAEWMRRHEMGDEECGSLPGCAEGGCRSCSHAK